MGFGSPSGTGLPQNDFSSEEDLGSKEIEGVLARGVRETQAVSDETGREIKISDEYWYSDELRINLVMKHSDPRTGTTTLRVTQITRENPIRRCSIFQKDIRGQSNKPNPNRLTSSLPAN